MRSSSARDSSGANELLVLAPIVTMDPRRPRAEAMLIRDGRTVSIGTREAVREVASDHAETVQLRNGTIVPGLIDSHNHMLWTGMQSRLLDLAGCRGIAEIQERIRAHAAAHPDEAWIVSSEGWFIDGLEEKRHPTRDELDAACADRPVYLPRLTHAAAANSVALEIAGIHADSPDVAGGVIVRDADTRRPTGELLEAPAFELVGRHVPPRSVNEQLDALDEIQVQYHRVGLTGIVDPSLKDDERALYGALHEAGRLTMRTVMMPLADTTRPAAELAEWVSGLEGRTGDGDEWLKLGALKIFVDGIASMGTALLREPYPNQPQNRGTQVAPEEALRAVAEACAVNGWSLGLHTVGGAAIDLALRVFEAVDARNPIADLRFSLIHAYLWPSAENIATAARLGVVAAVQPPMQEWIAPRLIDGWGEDAAARATPLRAWLDGGVVVGGGSDCPLTSPDPLVGIWQAVSREVPGRGVVGPDQRLTSHEALELYTRGAAFLSFSEHERGSLEPGKVGDWVALSLADPLAATPEEWAEAEVLTTCVGGRIVHETQ